MKRSRNYQQGTFEAFVVLACIGLGLVLMIAAAVTS